MTPLRQQMQADMQLRGLAVTTQKAYIDAVAVIARHYRRAPDRFSQVEVEQYLLYLINERKLAWSSTNQAASAMRFFFRVTLKRPDTTFAIPAQQVRLKIFGYDADDCSEDGYYESFFNVDLPGGFVYWNEKDEDYFAPMLRALAVL